MATFRAPRVRPASSRSRCCRATSRRTRNSFPAAASRPRCAGTANSCAMPSASLVVTPETALPLLPQQLPAGYLDAIQARYSQGTQAAIVGLPMGGPGQLQQLRCSASSPALRSPTRTASTTWCLSASSFRWAFRWFIQMMNIPLGDFERGGLAQAPFVWQGQRIAPNICYEDLFGDEIGANFRDEAHGAHHPAQREQHRVVRRLGRHRPAPVDLAHARPRVRAADGALHQHRRHGRDRSPKAE